MSKLDDFIAKSEHFQGEVLARLENMEKQRIEDNSAQHSRFNNHGERIASLEKMRWYVAGLIGAVTLYFEGRHK